MRLPRRVCFVAYRGNMQCGGQGIYLWFLTRELAKLGIELDVLVGPPYPDPMPFVRRVQRIPNREMWAKWFTREYDKMLPVNRPTEILTPLNFYELAASRLGFLPEPFAFSVRAFRAIATRIALGERWDLVHDVQCLGYGLLGLQAMGLPVVTTVHHPLTVDRRASFIRDATLMEAIGTQKFYPIGMQSFVARRLQCVLTSSEASAAEIVRDFRVPAQKVRNVHNGLDTDLYSPDPGVSRSAAELLCVGRAVDPNKGIRVLINALAHLPEHVTLTLVDDDSKHNPVRKWAHEAGVGARLNVTGRVPIEKLVELYRRATLAVVPSRYEGFGLPAVEAMACGTPVVACAAGSLPEVMQISQGGVVVEKDSAHAIAKGVRELLESPEHRARLGERARQRILDAFSWPRVAQATAEVYAEVLA